MLRKKMMRVTVIACCLAIFIATGMDRAVAHHGWSEYDNSKTLNLSGKIQAIGYDNPHVVIQLQTKEKVWEAVLAPPSRLQNRGLPPKQLQVGETVSVEGYPHRSEENEMRAEQITVGEKTVPLR
jgi:Family of unknown function (DUF6152)